MEKTENVSNRSSIETTRSVYYSLTDEGWPGLTDEEKNKLESVMKKAMEFEEEEAHRLRLPHEGQLYKYTNVVKGWQFRWFIITPDSGMLEYYMLDETKKSRPRGAIYLAGAVVSASEKDDLSFIVSAGCGEVYRLKANDAADRNTWIDKIQTVIDLYVNTTTPEIKTESSVSSFALCKGPLSGIDVPGTPKRSTLRDLNEIKESVHKAIECQKGLAKTIEGLPSEGNLKFCDHKLLLIKAVSQASVQSLEQCFLILKHQKKEAIKSRSSSTGIAVQSLE